MARNPGGKGRGGSHLRIVGAGEGSGSGGGGSDGAPFDLAAARRLLGEVFAPWVLDLKITVERVETAPPKRAPADWQPGALLKMPFSDRLCREGGVICGQSLMTLADTAMVFAVAAASNGYRPMTTVDLVAHFMKPAAGNDIIAEARLVRLGRSMAFGRVMLLGAGDGKPVAMVSSAYALL